MYAIGVAEIASHGAALVAGAQFVGGVLMALVLLGALPTLVRHHENHHISPPSRTHPGHRAGDLFLSYTAGEPSIAGAVNIVVARLRLRSDTLEPASLAEIR